jgi:hypothetical protein
MYDFKINNSNSIIIGLWFKYGLECFIFFKKVSSSVIISFEPDDFRKFFRKH